MSTQATAVSRSGACDRAGRVGAAPRSIRTVWLLAALLFAAALAGCSGGETFSKVARAGDTVLVAIGTNISLSRATVSVRITDGAGVVTQYPLGDARIRAAMNLYPDPVSNLMMGWFTNQNINSEEPAYGNDATILSNPKHDWREAMVFVDLPASMAVGPATIEVTTGNGTVKSSTVEIVAGVGSPHNFGFTEISNSGDSVQRFQSLERARFNRVYLKLGPQTPAQAVQITLTHAPDMDHGGAGRVFVTHARPDLMSLNWHDDGTTLRVIMSRAGAAPATATQKPMFSFYVAGGIKDLTPVAAVAVDATGTPLANTPTIYISPLIDSVEPAGPLAAGTAVTLRGSGFCQACAGESEVWVLSGSQWIQVTPTSVTRHEVRFVMPGGIPAGPGVVWVGSGDSETDVAVQFQ